MSSDKPDKVGSNPISAGYSRLVRSLSKGNPSTLSTTAPAESPPPSTSGSPQASRTTSSTSVETSTSGLTAMEKFKNMAALVTTKKEKETPEWPPSSWINNSSTEEKPPPEAVPLPTDTNESNTGDKEGEGATSEPASLARQIQAMLSNMSSSLPALPSVYSSTPVTPADIPPSPLTPSPTPATPTANNDTTSQQTPPPPPPTPGIIDSKLAALLSSASVMNGSISKGRQSVWTALERLRAPKPATSPSPPIAQQPEGTAEEPEIDDDDSSGVMLYAPLVPDDRSEVEIARSEVSYVDQDGGVVGKAEEDWNERREVLAKEKLDTLRERKRDSKEKEKEEVQAQENAIKKGKGKEPKPKKVREVRVWVPSPTQISFQATWWGFRLYLPPPVLDILGNKQLVVAQRAAMVTTALKWLLDHLPIKLFPPQFRPILMVVKRLGPYLGYIGSGIAWGWAGIKAFDKGNGVILTATWLLPVALIPGTWEDGMFDPPGPSVPLSDAEQSGSVLPPPEKTEIKDGKSSKATGKSR
ncbi:hypothetical protein HWV62_36775 [Athelia sp. TMB]|nr:hypothetical protein HWV62_36775 [Athelia sp. TMB]